MTDRFEQRVGNYLLGAFPWEGGYAGTVRHSGKKLDIVEVSTFVEAKDWTLRRVNELLLDDDTIAKVPGHDQVVDAFKRIMPLPKPYLKMLAAHRAAPGRVITATQLTSVAGFDGVQQAGNLHYGTLAYRLWCELPRHLPHDGTATNPGYTFVLASGEKKDEWEWTMRPHIAEALAILQI